MKGEILRRSALSLLVAVALAGCGDKESSIQGYLESGQQFLEEGDIARSNLQFRNVLQIDPDNVDAHRYLAEIAERQENWEELYARLMRVERLAPDDLDNKLRLARLLIVVGESQNAANKADEILEVEPENAQAILVKATVALQQGDPQAAMTEGMRSLMIDDQSTDTLIVLAGAHRMMGENERAMALVDEALQINPNEQAARMIRIEMNRQNERFDLVENDLRFMLENQPNSEDFTLALAGLLNQLDRKQEAEALLDSFVRENPGSIRAMRGYIEIVDSVGDRQRAGQLLREFIGRSEGADVTTLQFILVERLLSSDETIDALQLLEQMMQSEQATTRHRARSRRAELHFAAGENDAALAQLTQVLQEDGQSEPALLVRSRFFLQEGRVDDAVRDLRVVLRNNPDSEAGLTLLGNAYLGSGSNELADSNFRQVLRLNPGNIDAAVPVITRLLADGDLGRSEQILVNALRRQPGNESLLSLLAQVRLMRNDFVGTEAVIEELQAMGGNNTVIGEFLSGRIFQQQGQHAIAMTRFESALAQEPRFLRALEGYAISQFQLEQTDELLSWLNNRITADPEFLGNYTVKAGLMREIGDLDGAISVIDTALQVVPEWVQGYVQMAGFYQLQDQTDGALNTYSRGLENVEDLSLLALRASLLEQQGRFEEAIADYEAAYALAPNNAVIQNNLAANLLSMDPSEENVRRALELTRNFRDSEEPYFLDTHGWALFNFGEVQDAERLIRRAIEGLPDHPTVNYHYGRVLLAQNRFDDARVYLAKANQLSANDALLNARVRDALSDLESANTSANAPTAE
ncbi:tetratricopeptide repeat protein [Nitrincola schmidtii]|uniref:tetratricopeptide repeat protein n=1 Tax=Nitrincola schmidtii TaxID=1730894 RepID=UPI00124CC3C3|nr:tetratricopeptide repeat protein [Nitrincola schmidtii]